MQPLPAVPIEKNPHKFHSLVKRALKATLTLPVAYKQLPECNSGSKEDPYM